jgi:hypothetical protein
MLLPAVFNWSDFVRMPLATGSISMFVLFVFGVIYTFLAFNQTRINVYTNWSLVFCYAFFVVGALGIFRWSMFVPTAHASFDIIREDIVYALVALSFGVLSVGLVKGKSK